MKKIIVSLIAFLMTISTSLAQTTLEDKVLPLRERAKVMDDLLKHRLDTLVPELMRREGIDAWVVISREYNEDPVLKTMLPATWLSARRRTVLIFLDHGEGSEQGVERMAAARYGVADIFEGSWDPDEQPDQVQPVQSLEPNVEVLERTPDRLLVEVEDTLPKILRLHRFRYLLHSRKQRIFSRHTKLPQASPQILKPRSSPESSITSTANSSL